MSTGLYVRWKRGEPREIRVFPPLPVDHPAAGKPCLACGTNLFGGIDSPRDILLLALGPEPEEREEKGDGAERWYNAVALGLHASCALPGYVEGSLEV